MNSSANKLKIALTSSSLIKIKAVQRSFSQCFSNIDIEVISPPFTPTSSQIPQPFFQKEGLAMCQMRICTMLDQHKNLVDPESQDCVDLIVSIENFIDLPNENVAEDQICILIYDPTNKMEYHRFYPCSGIPEEAMYIIKKLFLEPYVITDIDPNTGQSQVIGAKTTFGELYHQEHKQVPANNWMMFIGRPRVNREDQIAQGLSELLEHRLKWDVKLRQNLNSCFRFIPDFPIPGVKYMMWDDIFLNPNLISNLITYIASKFVDIQPVPLGLAKKPKIDYVIGVESRGFLLSSPLSEYLQVGQILLRKKGKIAGPRVTRSYQKEYGEDTLELRSDLPSGNVLIMDDVLATGGSLKAAAELAREAGHNVISCVVIKDVPPLRQQASQKLGGIPYWVVLP